MKKTWILIGAAAFCGLSLAKPALAGGTQISVTFDSIQQLEAKNGDKLDGSVKFYFADEKGHGKGGEIITSHAGGSGMGRDKEGKCRWALLGTFLKYQKRAKEEGKSKVVDITTASSAENDPDSVSGSRDRCLCSANAFKVSSLVKGRLAGGDKD
jgi:hypothetical protein